MKRRLNLDKLHVTSFITKEGEKTLKGGERLSFFCEVPIGETDDTYDFGCHQKTVIQTAANQLQTKKKRQPAY
ncbi:MAG: pinensin family lanthipeptide [Cyclobacteriaceae bacterium]